MTGWRSLVRGVALVAYAIGLPLAIFSLASAVWTLIADGPQPALVGMATGALAFAALIGWRLQLNLRAAGWRLRDMPQGMRARAMIWRGGLAVIGLPVLLAGLAWTVTAVLVVSGGGAVFVPDQGALQPLTIGWGMLVAAVIVLGAGLALQIPLLRMFTRRPSADQPPTGVAIDD